MKRRALLVSGVAMAILPSRPAAQRVRTIGYLSNGADASTLEKALAARGYVPGRDLRIIVQFSSRDKRELEERARALVAARPDVLVAWGAHNIHALARLTRTVPIVCGGTADPVGIGYAKSIRRPGGNITGLSYGVPEMAPIIVGLMRAVRPELHRITMFTAESRQGPEGWSVIVRSIEAAAREKSIGWEYMQVGSTSHLERALDPLDPRTSVAYLVNVGSVVDGEGAAKALIRRRLASSTNGSGFVRKGVLMHYSIDHADPPARVAAIIDTLLRGADPAEVPFDLPEQTTFVLNRATAKAIGITLSPELLARATEIVG